MVHEGTVCIYLKASIDTLLSHLEDQADGRPLLNNSSAVSSCEAPSVMSSEVETSPLRKRILELMSLRAATYERTAHQIIDTDNKTIQEIAAEICCLLNRQS
jgi:shikimate kinase